MYTKYLQSVQKSTLYVYNPYINVHEMFTNPWGTDNYMFTIRTYSNSKFLQYYRNVHLMFAFRTLMYT